MSDKPYPVPRASYRLQLNKDFTFSDAASLAPYLADLGISHAYLSPILRARRGSLHGYDTVEHREINPELGGFDGFHAMARTLREHGIGILLDFVPNHMGIGGAENVYWLDLLEWGRHSRYAHWFDVNWAPSDPTLRNRVLVPFLGQSYDEALRDGHLLLKFDRSEGTFAIWADATSKLPIRPQTYAAILADGGEELQPIAAQFRALAPDGHSQAQALKSKLARLSLERKDLCRRIELLVDRRNGSAADRDALDALIAQQNWRVARFSVAADDINYRRFFIVNDLAGIRVEQEEVFDHVHGLIFQLVGEGWIDGLRVDHIDGLFDPKAYCVSLRRKCPRPIYLAVEKILAPHEQLRPDWHVDGTTGYEFGARIGGLLADPATVEKLSSAYAAFTGADRPFAETEREAKRAIIDDEMAAELDALAERLRKLAAAERSSADITRNSLRVALRDFVACMPVYRTYVDEHGASQRDRRYISYAVAAARRAAPSHHAAALDFIGSTLTRHAPSKAAALQMARRIQQYTGPVMAKGLEDTALYRDNRLIALNEVGARPDRSSASVGSFHDFNRRRQANMPDTLLATSTHDTKRGEDARARVVAISGRAGEWAQSVREWHRVLAEAGAPEIERNDAWLFFQMLLGAWPLDFPRQGPVDEAALSPLRQRVAAAMLKSVREAKINSSWAAPHKEYEQRMKGFIDVALSPRPDNRFLALFRQLEAQMAVDGIRNSLIMTTLKLTAPGIPDIYQGAELWEQSMVDPDNRRPVDFQLRRELLAERSADAPLPPSSTWRDGRIKLALTQKLLRFRMTDPELFARGSYEPLAVSGDGDRICAFLRRIGERAIIVAAALWPWRELEPFALKLPDDLHSVRWSNILAGGEIPPSDELRSEHIFAELTVAVLAPTLTSPPRSDRETTSGFGS